MQITATHKKAINQYYNELAGYDTHKVTHETALRSAFQNLLYAFAQSANWTLIPEQTLSNGKRPDASLLDNYNLYRGYWEAKDTNDDLASEINKKIALGYPTSNIIFEDTRRAILYQNKKPVFDADLRKSNDLIDLLQQFFTYVEPEIATFDVAVQEFKERIPDLALRLLTIIREEYKRNQNYRTAFFDFHEVCRTSIDPNINREVVEEMLVQHLLTERLFRTIFNNTDFTSRNVIASEIEKVIQALTSHSFNRAEFLERLDRFYIAIEGAARNQPGWSEKQYFLNTVYERFFQGFSKKQADKHGVIYTPQEIVDFMWDRVEEVLLRDFNTSLSQQGVQILDPCTGTGNFIVNLLRRISGSSLTYKYTHDLFCNEIMLLPYYIASLNIEHAYYERTGLYKAFEGICFADTLELAEERRSDGTLVLKQPKLLMVEANTERVERAREAQIMVVIGNPPYNVGQKSENDNNKNRRYPVIDQRIRETYVKDSKASNKNSNYDAYLRFFRWATDRIGDRDGIVCFVSNNGFFGSTSGDGIRKHLLKDFTSIYHFDLKGDARTSGERRRAEGGNVFEDKIREGVGITILIRAKHHEGKKVWYHSVGDRWSSKQKRSYLRSLKYLEDIVWQPIVIDAAHNWLIKSLPVDFAAFLPMGTKEMKSERAFNVHAIFKKYGRGVATSRDNWAFDFDRTILISKIEYLIETYNSEIDRWRRHGNTSITIDDFVIYDDSKIKWSRDLKLDLRRGHYADFSETKVRVSQYRPYCKQWLFFDRILNEEVYLFPQFFPTPASEVENVVICVSGIGSSKPFHCLVSNTIPCLDMLEKTQCFSYYTYAEDGSNRRENITDWALAKYQAQYGSEISKRDIFSYIYAMLHHPQYREHYAENLKRHLPYIPLLKKHSAFEKCVRIGKRLMELHLNYERAVEYPLKWNENREVPINWRVKKMHLTPNKDTITVNEWLRLTQIPEECYQYRLGNLSALEWVIDQYQMSSDVRSGIKSDPNRVDDPEYIVRLIGRVVTVSIETVRLVSELEQAVKMEDWIPEIVVEA